MLHRTLRLIAVALAAAGAATSGACVSYDVRQSSLVPMPTLPPTPSRVGRADVLLSSNTLTGMVAPERVGRNSDSALWVPSEQVEGAFALRVARGRASIRLDWMHGFSEGSRHVLPNDMPRPDRAVWGLGTGVTVHFGDASTTGGWEVDLSGDALMMSVPSWVETRTRTPSICFLGPCTPETVGPPVRSEQTDSVMLYSVSLVVGYRVDPRLRVFATVAMRNHPVNHGAFMSDTGEAEVYVGPFNLLAGLGVEVGVTDWLALIPQVAIPVTEAPVRYAPVISLGVRATVPGA